MTEPSPDETVQAQLVVGGDTEYPVEMDVTTSRVVDEESGELLITLDEEGMDEYVAEFEAQP